MYRSLQYITFTSCNVVVLRCIILYCDVGRRVRDNVVQSSAVAHSQMLGLGVTVRVRVRAREWNYYYFFSSVLK